MIAVGVPQGKGMGKLLNDLLEKVLEQSELNNRECLLSLMAEAVQEGTRNE